MIKLTVLYPSTPGARFDLDYYCKQHLALLKSHLGDACRRIVVGHGLSAAAPGSAPPFLASCDLYFDSVAAFEQAFLPHLQVFRADHPNYTDVAPLRLISEVVVEVDNRRD